MSYLRRRRGRSAEILSPRKWLNRSRCQITHALTLLLRTRDSMALGIRGARRADAWMPKGATVLLFPALLGPLAIRIGATIAIAVKNPATCLRAIPSNWWQLVARIDSSMAPVPIPGLTGQPSPHISGWHRSLWKSGFLPYVLRRLLRAVNEMVVEAVEVFDDRGWFARSLLIVAALPAGVAFVFLVVLLAAPSGGVLAVLFGLTLGTAPRHRADRRGRQRRRDHPRSRAG